MPWCSTHTRCTLQSAVTQYRTPPAEQCANLSPKSTQHEHSTHTSTDKTRSNPTIYMGSILRHRHNPDTARSSRESLTNNPDTACGCHNYQGHPLEVGATRPTTVTTPCRPRPQQFTAVSCRTPAGAASASCQPGHSALRLPIVLSNTVIIVCLAHTCADVITTPLCIHKVCPHPLVTIITTQLLGWLTGRQLCAAPSTRLLPLLPVAAVASSDCLLHQREHLAAPAVAAAQTHTSCCFCHSLGHRWQLLLVGL